MNYKKKLYKNYDCNVQKSILMIGEKWTLFIIREFIYGKETQRFNQLMRTLKPISSRTLALKLKKLEENKILKRKIINERPIKIEYSITKKGKDLKIPLQKMGDWFSSHPQES